jgi:hypothetical protein
MNVSDTLRAMESRAVEIARSSLLSGHRMTTRLETVVGGSLILSLGHDVPGLVQIGKRPGPAHDWAHGIRHVIGHEWAVRVNEVMLTPGLFGREFSVTKLREREPYSCGLGVFEVLLSGVERVMTVSQAEQVYFDRLVLSGRFRRKADSDAPEPVDWNRLWMDVQ